MANVAYFLACVLLWPGAALEAEAHWSQPVEEVEQPGSCAPVDDRRDTSGNRALLQLREVVSRVDGASAALTPEQVNAKVPSTPQDEGKQSGRRALITTDEHTDTGTGPTRQLLFKAKVNLKTGAVSKSRLEYMYNSMLDKMTEIGAELGPGTHAPLDQDGYDELAKLKDPQQMEFFARRLISQMGLRVKDYYGLQGFIPFYDGEQMTQSFEDMKAEIENVAKEKGGWVTDEVSGASAPLTQDGYAQVAILANNREMAEFVRRVVSDLGLSVEDEGGLQGLSQWHSGDKGVSTFGELQGELINASKSNDTWVAKAQPCPGTGHPSDEELDQLLANSSLGGNSSKEDAAESTKKPEQSPKSKVKSKVNTSNSETKEVQMDKTSETESKKDAHKAAKDDAKSGDDGASKKSEGKSATNEVKEVDGSDDGAKANKADGKAATNDDAGAETKKSSNEDVASDAPKNGDIATENSTSMESNEEADSESSEKSDTGGMIMKSDLEAEQEESNMAEGRKLLDGSKGRTSDDSPKSESPTSKH